MREYEHVSYGALRDELMSAFKVLHTLYCLSDGDMEAINASTSGLGGPMIRNHIETGLSINSANSSLK